jgi:hypothetical protein
MMEFGKNSNNLLKKKKNSWIVSTLYFSEIKQIEKDFSAR